MLVKADGVFYEKNTTNKKVTAAHTFVKGKTYNIPSREAKIGERGNYLEILPNADQIKHADAKQKKAFNAKAIAEKQAAEKEAAK